MRGLGFVPLIYHHHVSHWRVCGCGLYLCLCGRLCYHRIQWSAVSGAVVISAEVLLLRSIGKWLGRYPSVRNASDNIRNAMNMLMEMALLVGSIFAAIKMAGYTGFYRG
ncbi:YhfT family protein [Escherichia coli]